MGCSIKCSEFNLFGTGFHHCFDVLHVHGLSFSVEALESCNSFRRQGQQNLWRIKTIISRGLSTVSHPKELVIASLCGKEQAQW